MPLRRALSNRSDRSSLPTVGPDRWGAGSTRAADGRLAPTCRDLKAACRLSLTTFSRLASSMATRRVALILGSVMRSNACSTFDLVLAMHRVAPQTALAYAVMMSRYGAP